MTRTHVDAAALREVVRLLSEPPPRRIQRTAIIDPRVLGALGTLVPSDSVIFNDMIPRRKVQWAGSAWDGPGTPMADNPVDDEPRQEDDFFELFWDSDCSHPDRTGDWESVFSISDLSSLRQQRNSPMYAHLREYWTSFDRELLVPLPGPPGRSRRIRFLREHGLDFDDTDRAIATLLRPHLVAHLRALDLASRGVTPLTTRQRQLLSFVADGFTNAQTARTLGISPATVRTHLQQIYERLGVTSRGEAVALLNPLRASSQG